MKTYLGLDLGSKTLGVSISNTGIIASGLTTIRFTENNYQEAIDKFSEVIKSYTPETIVLGYPKHMNNDVGILAQSAINFKQMLEGITTVPIVLWDERLSTKMALKSLSDQKKKNKTQRKLKDEMSAVFILQNYLDSLKGSLL